MWWHLPKKYVKKVRNTNYKIYCLHCNLLTEPGVVGEGDRDRIRQRRLTWRPAEALEPSQSICFWISTKRNSRCSVWERNQTKKKTADAFPSPPPPLLQVVANGFLRCQVTLLECRWMPTALEIGEEMAKTNIWSGVCNGGLLVYQRRGWCNENKIDIKI